MDRGDRHNLCSGTNLGFETLGGPSVLLYRASISELDAHLLATVSLWVDYTVPVEDVRRELRTIVASTDNWKGNVCVLQVTDASEHTIQLRALMDARDAGKAWDLRCYVREKLIQFLQQRYPDSLPRFRTDVRILPPEGKALYDYIFPVPNISPGQKE